MLSREFFNKLFFYYNDSRIRKLFKIPMFVTLFMYVIIGYLIVEMNEYLGVWLQANFIKDVNLPGVWSIGISVISIIITFFLIVFTFSYLYSVVGSLFFEKVSHIILQSEKVRSLSENQSAFRKMNYFFQHLIFISILTAVCFVLSFIPLLNIITTGIFVSYNFLSFSYSAHSISVRAAIADVKKHWLTYVIVGNVFSILLVIPVVNIFVFPLAVIFYTLIYAESIRA